MGTGLGKARSGVQRSPFHLVGEEPEPTKRFNWRHFRHKAEVPRWSGIRKIRVEEDFATWVTIIGEPLNQSSQLG